MPNNSGDVAAFKSLNVDDSASSEKNLTQPINLADNQLLRHLREELAVDGKTSLPKIDLICSAPGKSDKDSAKRMEQIDKGSSEQINKFLDAHRMEQAHKGSGEINRDSDAQKEYSKILKKPENN